VAEQTKSKPRRTARVLPEKKRKREARIIDSASKLFSCQGYAETSIEAIAQQADVAVGTVYNYFQNKPALLMRVLTNGRSQSLIASAALAEDPPNGPVEAMFQLVSAQMHGANRHEKELWRVIHATAALEPEAFGQEYFLGKEQFTNFIVQLLETLRGRDQLPKNADIKTISKTIKYVASEVFRRYVADDHISFDDARDDLKSMIEFIMNAAVK
jgi:AcrR family transcriptional regulator